MPKKNIKSALANSLKHEDLAVEQRFQNAETALAKRSHEPLPSRPTSPANLVIRDSFTMPDDDYQLLALLKKRALNLAVSVNKSQLLRAGLIMLNNSSDKAFVDSIEQLDKVNVGRPPVKD